MCCIVPCCAMLCYVLQLLSKVMDNAFTIPVINKRFGLDALIGLVPYVGVYWGFWGQGWSRLF